MGYPGSEGVGRRHFSSRSDWSMKATTASCLLALTLVVGCDSRQTPSQRPAGFSDRTPPGLSAGMKVYIRWTSTDDIKAISIVEEVRGNWVRVQAETVSGKKIQWV